MGAQSPQLANKVVEILTEVKRVEDRMEQNKFPVPNSGRITTVDAADELTVECTDISKGDKDRLQNFLWRMGGRSGEFSFELAKVLHPKCRFASDWVDFAPNGPDKYKVKFFIKVLPLV